MRQRFFPRSIDLIKTCLTLLGPETRSKWTWLIALAVFVSILEAVTALVILTLLAVVMSGDTSIVVPILGDVSERYPDLTESRPLLIACLLVGLLLVVRALVYFAQSYFQNRLAYSTAKQLSLRLLHGYLTMPYLTFTQRNSSELIRNAHESAISFATWVLLPGITLAAETFVVIALAVVLLLTSPLVALLAFALLGVLVILLLRVVQPRLHALGLSVQHHGEQSLKSLQQTLHGLRDIRVLGAEHYFEEEFSRTRDALARAYSTRGVLIDAPRITLEASVLLLVLLLVAMQVARDTDIGTGLATLGMLGYAALRVLPSVNRIVNGLQALRFAVPLTYALYADVTAATEATSDLPDDPEPQPEFTSLELRGVGFRYPTASENAISGLDLAISKGEKVGIVGETGSGKSTLLDLMLGLIHPSTGTILVNGKELAGREGSWRRQIAIVPQTMFLLDDSVERNIALGVAEEQMDRSAIEDALRFAQLEQLVTTLPDGLETVVGERGVRLSGGQRQRVAIARALFRKPKVLFLDEGTSALDNRTEDSIIGHLAAPEAGLTIISVAHRVSSIQDFDRIIMLHEGRLVASGTYEELLETSEAFRSLVRATARSSTSPPEGDVLDV